MLYKIINRQISQLLLMFDFHIFFSSVAREELLVFLWRVFVFSHKTLSVSRNAPICPDRNFRPAVLCLKRFPIDSHQSL